MNTVPLTFFALAILVLGLAAGCSTINQRKAERIEAYRSLPPAARELVDQGKLERGLSTNAVYIAWGAPSMVATNSTPQGPQLVWFYFANRAQRVPNWVYLPNSQGTWTLDYQPAHYSRKFTRAEVVFREGRVVHWERFPSWANQ